MSYEFENDCRFVTRSSASNGRPPSDKYRDWCLSVKQPLASLIVDGKARAITKSGPPPVELYRCDLFIHAGGGDIPFKYFTDAAKEMTEAHFGRSLKVLRHGDPENDGAGRAIHGALIGKARLISAFKIGRELDGVAYASLKDNDARHAVGAWREFDGKVRVIGDAKPGRWVWVFQAPEVFAAPEPMPGSGYVFDLEKWRGVLAAQAAREDALERQAVEALTRGYSA